MQNIIEHIHVSWWHFVSCMLRVGSGTLKDSWNKCSGWSWHGRVHAEKHSSWAGHNRGKEIPLLVPKYKGRNSVKYSDGIPFVQKTLGAQALTHFLFLCNEFDISYFLSLSQVIGVYPGWETCAFALPRKSMWHSAGSQRCLAWRMNHEAFQVSELNFVVRMSGWTHKPFTHQNTNTNFTDLHFRLKGRKTAKLRRTKGHWNPKIPKSIRMSRAIMFPTFRASAALYRFFVSQLFWWC